MTGPEDSAQRSYQLVHNTLYSYDAEVTTSYGQAHLAVAESPQQWVRHRELVIDPPAAEVREHQDFFGNTSTFFVVRQAHKRLSVTARSELRVERVRPDSALLNAMSIPQARQQTSIDPALADFVLPSPRVSLTPEVRDYAAEVFDEKAGVGSAISALVGRIHEDFRYRTGATTVLTDLQQLLRARAGVCQDFAHLAVGCLRSAGLAARYVSGYLETRPAPGKQKLQGADASHAWASVYVPAIGWVDFDPTNNQFVDSRYVVAAVGRDYGDVPPLKGVIVTSATHSTLRVSVDVTRIL